MPVVRASEFYDNGIIDVIGVDTRRLADVAVWAGRGPDELRSLAERLAVADGDAIPVALAGPTPSDDPVASEFVFPGLGDTPQQFAVIDRDRSLPRASGRAFLFDLDLAVRMAEQGAGLSDNTRLRYEVWASDLAPADLDARLATAGVQILGTESIAGELDRLARGAPALGLGLYLIAGAVAMLLAVGAVLLTAYLGAGTRRYELAALRVAGGRAGQLRRGLLREYAHVLGLPFLVGLGVGVAGAALMLPGIPLVTVGAATGVVHYQPGPGALVVAVATTLAGLVLGVLVVLRQVRRATPELLREGSAA